MAIFKHLLLQKYGRVGGGGGAAKPGKVLNEVTKNVTYVAGGTDSTQVLSIGADSSTAVKNDIPASIVVKNTGSIPIVAISVYESYTDDDTDAGPLSLQTMLLPNESFMPPTRGIIHGTTANALEVIDGTVVDFTTTLGDTTEMATFKSDSGDNAASGELNNTTDPVVFELDNGHEKYRVGDMLRVTNEILRVEGTYDDNPTSSTVADNHIVVSRGHHGSTAASHSGTPDIYFACFNEYHDYDIILSGSSQLCQTNALGQFKSSNFFGYGRVDATADNKTFGITPGSICFRFYSQASQEVYMGGTGAAGGTGVSNIPITSATSSQLTASTTYSFNLTIDDSSATTVSFTTDSSNVNFGGTNGIISKIQSAINTATRTAGNNLFGYSCSVGISNGNLRFVSNSYLSPHDGTNGSKILLEDGAGGTNVFTGAAGIFPDILNVPSPVKPVIAGKSVYNRLTYEKSPNSGNMIYDDGNGKLLIGGRTAGSINYETGAFNFTTFANAEFEVSLAHASPFSGKLNAAQEDTGVITAIHANVVNQNLTGEINIKVY